MTIADQYLCSAFVAHDDDCRFLNSLQIEGRIDFDNVKEAARDFGGMTSHFPKAVLYPSSVEDISTLLKAIYMSGTSSNLSVAAKGHAHSIHGQAQAANGVVVEMSSLRGIKVHNGAHESYADVRGGELWIDVLRETLMEGLAPKSWTDYLYLSVGGTLSNAGISGQAFLHGPQISNVYQLEVVTGKGDVVICSKDQNSDLFYATLGGLGQFGIITSARIVLETAPERVKWIRVLYSDFDVFSHDQEYLISQPHGETFDYIEGFMVVNSDSLIENWRSSLFKPQKMTSTNNSGSQPRRGDQLVYYLEVTKNYNASEADLVDKKVETLLAALDCMPSSVYSTDISYMEFLNRVHAGELKLRAKGLWEYPHPWLNLFVPGSKIAEFDAAVLKQIVGSKGGGPVLIYPMNRSRWDARMSVVIPDEDIFYLVGLLRSPSMTPDDPTTEQLIEQNEAILRFCKSARIGEKQYLPSFSMTIDWQQHFGADRWVKFVERKARYDPRAVLSPGQKIFTSALTNFAPAQLRNSL